MTTGRSWYIFTDACYEPDNAEKTAGGFFSVFLTEDLLAKLNITKRKTIIFECELLAIFVAMTCRSQHLQDSQVVVCTDNEGVKDAFIACQTSSYNATPILVALLQLEFDLKWNWDRVELNLFWIKFELILSTSTRFRLNLKWNLICLKLSFLTFL